MSNLQQVMDSLHQLGPADMLIVRAYLEAELKPSRPTQNTPSLVGLLADEPALADVICTSAMDARESRPWRATRG